MAETTQTTQTQNLTWKLNPQDHKKSIFDKVKCREHPNVLMINGFIKNEMGISTIQPDWEYKTELEHMIKYKHSIKNDIAFVQHKLPQHKWGRVNAVKSLTLGLMVRGTRHSLAQQNYIDIDMCNCQVQLLNQMSKIESSENDSEYEYLNKYCENYKNCRNDVVEYYNCDKDAAKQLFLQLTFGGSFKEWVKEFDIQTNDNKPMPFLNGFEKDMIKIKNQVYAYNRDTIAKDLKRSNPQKYKDENKLKRSVLAVWGQTLERYCQELAISYLVEDKKFKLEDIIPCQDGFMILKEVFYDTLINDIQTHIAKQTRIHMSWAIKAFDESYEIPEYDGYKSFTDWSNCFSTKELAQIFLKEFNHLVCCERCQGTMINVFTYNELQKRWYNDNEHYQLQKIISENLYENVKKLFAYEKKIFTPKEREILEKRLREQTSNTNSIQSIIKHIIPDLIDKGALFDANPILLGFKNGVLNLSRLHTTDHFRDYEYDDYITTSTNYDYIPYDPYNSEMETQKNKMKQIINDFMPNEKVQHMLLQILASALDGNLYEYFYCLNGKGGNGKGLIGKFMKACLGDYFCCPSNDIIKDQKANKNGASPDLMNLRKKRYINFTEIDGDLINTAVRKLTGGDPVSARALYGSITEFVISATFAGEFNTPPQLKGKVEESDYRRYIHIGFEICYTNDPKKIGQTINNIQYKKAIPYYKSNEYIEQMKLSFLYILLDTYKASCINNEEYKPFEFDIPTCIRQSSNKFLDNQNYFKFIFEILFEKVDDDNKKNFKESKTKLKLKDMYELIKTSEDWKEKTTAKERTNQYGRDGFYEYCFKHHECDTFKKTHYMKGVKTVEGQEDDE